MGARKRNTAEQKKEEARSRYQAILKNCPTSPRKMRLVTDLISGMEVNKALDVLKFSSQEASRRLEKLLLSAIANWQAKKSLCKTDSCRQRPLIEETADSASGQSLQVKKKI
jgi:large subunit ribosomal protein L22